MGIDKMKSWATGKLIEGGLKGISRVARLHPMARPSHHGVEVIRNVPYQDTGKPEHLLDIYRPDGQRPLPVVIYIHGGAFRILSKDTHWVMGLGFARRGYLVFNINYRLVPKNPFPAGLQDVSQALLWVRDNAAKYGGDPERIVFAGESAGANLATTLAIMCSFERPEQFAQQVFRSEVQPTAVVANCGFLDVVPRPQSSSDGIPAWMYERAQVVGAGYTKGSDLSAPGGAELASPLSLLEMGAKPSRPLAPFFASCGTRDPIVDQTRRLRQALSKRLVPHDVRLYDGEVHAFQAFVWREQSQQSWRDTYDFLDYALES